MSATPDPEQDRLRSHWAWGWADRLLDDQGLVRLGKMVTAMLGIPVSPPQRAPSLDAISLAPSRVAVPQALETLFDSSPFQRALHARGRSYCDVIGGFRGDYATAPDWVAFPAHAGDVAEILGWADANRVAIIPFGGGTSVVGGVTMDAETYAAHRAVVALDLSRMDRLLRVDVEGLSAHIEGGATGPILNAQLREHGLVLRHYPQSYEFATLGGMIATRSGGHFATVYTHIDDFVQALHTETPAGSMVSARVPSSGAGPSPDRLLMGSEGSLGIITSAWMRVRRRPVWKSTATITFARFGAAVDASRRLAQSQLFPSNCRVLDGREAALHRVAARGQSVLLVGFESAEHPVEPLMRLALELIGDCGGTLTKPPKHLAATETSPVSDHGADRWKTAFLDMPYLQSNLVRLGVMADTFETACTWDRFDALHDDLVKTVRRAMKASSPQGKGFVSCRFTHVYPDGPAPYYTFVCPSRTGHEAAQWRDIKSAVSEVIAHHGATISHHHAVGRIHLPWAEKQRPELHARVLAASKNVLDPNGILNPGVLFRPRKA